MRPVTYSWLAVVIGVCCAAIGWLGIAGWIAVAVLAASVAMHVLGNALGTRLRDATDRDLRRLRSDRGETSLLPRPREHRLGQRSGLGLLVPVSAGIGAACGGIAGTTALMAWTSSSVAGAALGGASAAVIGGLIGFLGASFVEIVRVSLREAIAAERQAAALDR
ncbi:MAG: hypothetical protein FJ286_06840 [Planctomycetes bacterium]|nr:hypothetical protein [Planctomycetota bacterium]